MSPDQILDQLYERHQARLAEFDLAEPPYCWLFDELADAWRAAQAEAECAYEHWCEMRTTGAFAVYRAAQDRADQAQDVLADRYAGSVATERGQGASSPSAPRG
jgi:hypothetical protein